MARTVIALVRTLSGPKAVLFIGALLAIPPLRAEPAVAAGLELVLPIDCVLGSSCWIANYADRGSGAGALDYTCGPLTYHGHGGTDFAVRDRGAMRRGVAVLSGADGIVERVRDGVADAGPAPNQARWREGWECGNGVLVAHGRGWTTQYCHMRKNSVTVKPGQRVAQGQPLGMVGQSGKAVFPHLHFNVRRDRRTVDPFAGVEAARACAATAAPLWRRKLMGGLKYRPFTIFNSGFAVGRPDMPRIRDGRRQGRLLPANAPALTVWVEVFGVRKGDQVVFRIIGPQGAIIHERHDTMARKYARWFGFSGFRARENWPRGFYTGEFTLVRPGLKDPPDGAMRTRIEVR